MNIFNLFKRNPHRGETVISDIPPGEIHVTRNWTDDPQTDTTVIIVGGQVHPEHLEAIKAILDGRAHVARYPRKKTLSLHGIGGVL